MPPLVPVVFAAVLLFQVSECQAQSCDSAFGSFMNCIGQRLADARTFQVLENEHSVDYMQQIRRCFASAEAEAQRSNKCVLDQKTLSQDVLGPSGPLKGCKFCMNLAHDLYGRYLRSSAAERKCFKKHLINGVISEMQPCIQNKIGDFRFKVPALPDFGAAADASDSVVKNIQHHLWARSRLDTCKRINPTRATNTDACMKSKQPGAYAKTCQTMNSCKATSVRSNCEARFRSVESATCQCFREKQALLTSKLHQVRDVLINAQSSSQCEQGIEAAIGPWFKKVMQALKDCSSPAGVTNVLQKIPPNKVIKVGCLKIVQLKGSDRRQTEIGFRFIDYFLDALYVRLIKFCQCA